MTVFIILIVLVLGYRYVSQVPHEKYKLKLAGSWESYAYLASKGLMFAILGIIYVMILLGVFVGVYFLLELILSKFNKTIFFKDVFDFLVQPKYFDERLIVLGTIASFFVAEYSAQDIKDGDWIEKLKEQNAILNIAVESIQYLKPVRVSLKSRKVYVGFIQSEQFENLDLENIMLLPLMSGYRDKDTLKVNFEVNYTDVYEKRGIIGRDDEIQETWWDKQKLDAFRITIRLAEVESIALHDIDLYRNEFEEQKPKQDDTTPTDT